MAMYIIGRDFSQMWNDKLVDKLVKAFLFALLATQKLG